VLKPGWVYDAKRNVKTSESIQFSLPNTNPQ
jgi:hypothetical protein